MKQDKADLVDDLVEHGNISEDCQEQLSWSGQLTELKQSYRSALACFACASVAIVIGYDMNLIGSIIANKEFVKQFGVFNEEHQAWTLPADRQLAWTICQFCSAMLGAVIVGTASDRFGRRICVFINIALLIIGTVVELVAPNWGVWSVAKVIFGFAMGFMQGNTQTYVAEIAHVRIRGFMLALFSIPVLAHNWGVSILFGIGLISLSLFTFLTPESPYYLAGKGWPLCGNYLTYFLALAGLEDAFLVTVIANVLSIFAVLLSFSPVEKIGRRPQLLLGLSGMIPCLLAITILGWVGRGTLANGRALAAFSIIWTILYYISLGAIRWTLVGEISSVRLRAKTTSIATITNAVCNLAWAVAIPYLINEEEADLGPKAGVVFLGPACALTVMAFFVVPETKGKTFAQLDRLFELRTPARKF
ncbi:Major facilitator-type transporter ecdC [Colletotrichum fructicola Nara gc5]|uniref:Major facilitator-type transporter ecdC n=1 Tax=Colletotrichum fructicola (strain Nara gc5) TaxID=1213859 RepID=A0A7J6JR11_COLFN|nr:Major facilitator-type transporter ecdC [Colletotrichum fructicola Nara gc5]